MSLYTATALPKDGDTIDASDVNTDLEGLIDVFNGNIDNDNISSTANILGTKINVNWQSWTPVFTCTGSMTFTASSVGARYCRIGKMVFFRLIAVGTTGGTASYGIYFTLPITEIGSTPANFVNTFTAMAGDTGFRAGFAYVGDTNSKTVIAKYDLSNWGLGASRRIAVTGFYEVA